ncbi:MAG: cation:proton antiporter [Nitrospirota bacterium]|nr:MAG: cation:proton antiporter [Nitrospirota bacterium]
MVELEFLKSLVIILGLSAVVVFVLDRIKVPSVVGFLIAGVLLGPHGLALISDKHLVEVLAEIGVILLLFTIGLEFSLRKIMALKKTVLIGGFFQVAITAGIVTGVAFYSGTSLGSSIALGFIISLSSTAIVLKLLFDRAEIDSPHGRASLGVLIFQDLCVVLFLLLIPLLAGGDKRSERIILVLLESVAIVTAVLLLARWIVPVLLHKIVQTRKSELFVITIIFLCFGAAFLTFEIGLSLALGAFIAGLIISESEYSYQALSDILPFRDSFNGIFFISVGMLMDITFLLNNATIVLAIVLGIIIIKIISTSIPLLAIGNNLRVSIHTSMVLSQIGEFSFVLMVAASKVGLIDHDNYQTLLSAAIVTMVMTPLFVSTAPRVSRMLTSHDIIRRLESMRSLAKLPEGGKSNKDHVIVVGYGVNGRNLTLVLQELEVPYIILELNNQTVLSARKSGEPIYFGDGTRTEILKKHGIALARVLVVAIADPAATRRIVALARSLNPDIYIVVRTRYIRDVEDLMKLRADEVITEEFETSIELFTRVLKFYRMSPPLIQQYADKIRADHYGLFIREDSPKRYFHDTIALMPEVDSEALKLSDSSICAGISIRDLDLRHKTGVTIVSIRRENEIIHNPDGSFILEEDDILYLIGNRDKLKQLMDKCRDKRSVTSNL